MWLCCLAPGTSIGATLIQNGSFAFLPENIFLQPVSLIGFTTSLRLLQLHMPTKTTYLNETGIILNL